MKTRGVFVDWGLNESKAYIYLLYMLMSPRPEADVKMPWNWSFRQL